MISKEEFEKQWLDEIVTGSLTTTQKGHRFAQKMLRDWHEIDAETAEMILCDGAGDGGIDAAVFVKEDLSEGLEGDLWILIQSKYGSAFAGADTIGIEAQKLFATLEGKRDRLSSLSQELVLRLRTFLQNRGEKDRLEFVLATTQKLSAEEIEYLNNVKTIGQSKFGECFEVDSISIETVYNRLAETETQAQDTKLTVPLATTVANSGEILLVGATTLPSVFRFMQEFKNRTGDLDLLYEKNVRKFLGNKRKVNKGIEKTIESYPERFGLYNNGITIVAEQVREAGQFLELVNPYIVNGCQTTRSIWAVLQRRMNAGGSAPKPEQIDWQSRLDKAVVITKIVVVGTQGEELLTETTRYTNSQNAVGEKDFIALEKDFRNWAPTFNSRYSVFLEIQRGAWEARRAFQKQNPAALPHFSESANAFDLLKAYAAGWLREPGIAYGKNPPFAPGGTLFNKIVNDPDFGVDSLYAAYQLQKLANGYGFGRGTKVATRGQTRYLFVMVALDLIKDLLINNSLPYTARDLTAAVIAFSQGDQLKHVGDAAVQLIDDYLTDGNDDSLFTEPEFQKLKDLNAILKSEKLGKGEEFFPKLKTQVALAKKMFRKTAPVPEMKKSLQVSG